MASAEVLAGSERRRRWSLEQKRAILLVAISGHHHDRQIRPPLFDLAQQRQPIHAGHVDVGQDECRRMMGRP
jgi:hypothetical protein